MIENLHRYEKNLGCLSLVFVFIFFIFTINKICFALKYICAEDKLLSLLMHIKFSHYFLNVLFNLKYDSNT